MSTLACGCKSFIVWGGHGKSVAQVAVLVVVVEFLHVFLCLPTLLSWCLLLIALFASPSPPSFLKSVCCITYLHYLFLKNEWNHRIQVFPQKLCTAYMKYHAITLVMRLYEEIASRFVSNVMLDKLTLDTFSSAKRRQREQNNNHNIAYFSINDMTREGWYANLIAFLADYSVHQVILAYGYYVYIRQHRLEKRQKRLAATAAANQGKAAADGGGRDDNDNDPFLHPGSLVLSFTKKSTLLALSRIIALAMASVGGALGTMVVPGWGTLAGTNFGDGIAASLTDDFVTDL